MKRLYMPVFFYSKKDNSIITNKDINSILFDEKNYDKFRSIEAEFLNKFGGEIIGFFAYDPIGALNDFDLKKNGKYLLVTSDYPFGSKNFLTKEEYSKLTKESYINFNNRKLDKYKSTIYGFRKKGFFGFGGISNTYELPDPFNIKPEVPYVDPSLRSASGSAPGSSEEEKKKAEAEKKKREEEREEREKEAAIKAVAAAKKAEAEKKEFEKKEAEKISAKLERSTIKKNTEVFKGYTEAQTAALCGKHAINHVLQEEKIVKNGDTPSKIKLNPILQTVKINLVDYCGKLEEDETAFLKNIDPDTEVEFDNNNRICTKPGYDNIRFDGLTLLLENYLYYTVNSYVGDSTKKVEMEKFIKINIQKRRCLGIILNLGAFHYVAISKYHTQGFYSYIDSVGSSSRATVNNYNEVADLMKSLSKKNIAGAIAIKDNEYSYQSVASRLLLQNLPGLVNGYYEISENDKLKLKTSYNSYAVILQYFEKEAGKTDFKSQHGESIFNAINGWHTRNAKDAANLTRHIYDNDIDGFIELVNNMNEEYYIDEFEKSKATKLPTLPPPPPPPLKDKTPEEIQKAIIDYNGTNTTGAIFTLLPQILQDNVPENTKGTTKNIDKAVIKQLRTTFKKAIKSVMEDGSLKGGKNSKKQKTYKKKLLRHKSRNTINRLKLVRQ